MDETQSTNDHHVENDRKWQVSRRRLLQIMGAAGAAAVAVQFGGGLLGKGASTAAAAGGPTASPDMAGMAATSASGVGSKRLRRWAMVIDLRKCDGCQSNGTPPQCTLGCIEGHFAPEPMEWIQVFEYDLPGGGTQFVPVPCQHCQSPPCVNVCPVGATWSTPEGAVLIDQNRCIGCRMCMAACPYDRRFFNWGDPPIPPQALLAEYSPERGFPQKKGTTTKCEFCTDMARAGRIPFCAQGCPHDAIYYGDFEEDLATNGTDVVELSNFLTVNQAYRLKEDLNTKPRVYYIPGYGQDVGRDPFKKGRLQTAWPWQEKVKGAKTWNRSHR